jgi:hypothetical protein
MAKHTHSLKAQVATREVWKLIDNLKDIIHHQPHSSTSIHFIGVWCWARVGNRSTAWAVADVRFSTTRSSVGWVLISFHGLICRATFSLVLAQSVRSYTFWAGRWCCNWNRTFFPNRKSGYSVACLKFDATLSDRVPRHNSPLLNVRTPSLLQHVQVTSESEYYSKSLKKSGNKCSNINSFSPIYHGAPPRTYNDVRVLF